MRHILASDSCARIFMNLESAHHPQEVMHTMATITINNKVHSFSPGEHLIDIINRARAQIPQVCYHTQLGPIQTCDTCMVEVDGQLARACAVLVEPGMSVATATPAAKAAQGEA